MCTAFQLTRVECDFIFKLGLLGVAPGSEKLIVQPVFGQRLFLNPLNIEQRFLPFAVRSVFGLGNAFKFALLPSLIVGSLVREQCFSPLGMNVIPGELFLAASFTGFLC